MLLIKCLFTLVCACTLIIASAQTIIYVNKNSSGGLEDGSSWANAYNELSIALPTAQYGDEIWVAKGVYSAYIPDESVSFILKNGVKLLGGFAGTETEAHQRNWEIHTTTLTGMGPFPFLKPNNVVYCEGTDSTTLLDGFTIRDGFATHIIGVTECEDTPDERTCHGGGLFVYSGDPGKPTFLTVRNCHFTKNLAEVGGAIAVNFWTGSGGMHVERCRFDSNTAQVHGCSVFIGTGPEVQHDIVLDNCVFENHFAYYNPPVVVIINLNDLSAPRIIHSIFRNNFTGLSGTCIYTENYGKTKPVYESCHFIENKAGENWLYPGRGGVLLGWEFDVRNCYFFKNRANSGGAIAGEGMEISGCVFDRNYAGYEGAALCISRKNLITHNLFIHNYSARFGGAISNSQYTQDSISNCIFIGNVAAEQGNWMATAFANIYVDHTYIDVPNCESLKDGLHPMYDTLTCGPHLYFVDTDPMLRDTANGDYRLGGCSPLLNQGDILWAERLNLFTDFAGNPRVLDSLPDIGPYEIPLFHFTTLVQNATNLQTPDGSVLVDKITGGTAPYKYLWSTGATNTSLMNLLPGVYTLTITDQQGCTASGSSEIKLVVGTYQQLESQQIYLSPNPSTGLLQLDMPDGGTLHLFDAAGNLVRQHFNLREGAAVLRFDDLMPGVYQAQVATARGVFWGKWIKI